jgi:hypothetical protein
MTYRTLVSSIALAAVATVAALTAITAVPTSAGAQNAEEWKIDTLPAKDGGAPATLLELRGDYGVDPWPDPFFPILAVKCAGSATSVFVVTGGPTQPNAGNEAESSVFYHLDNQPRKNAVWARSTSADTLTAPDGAAMLHELIGVKRFRFGFTLDHGDRTIFQFTPTGLDAALAKVPGACSSPD